MMRGSPFARSRSAAMAGMVVVWLGLLVGAVAEARGKDDMLARAPEGPMAGVEDIVFAVRCVGTDGHWYANFGYWDTDANRMMYGRDGGRLCRFNVRSGEVIVLLNDPTGSVRDPAVHYGGDRILFSYRKGGSSHFHLYEISADGTGLRQLTDGPYDDIEPAYLPGGGIVFCSSRCKRWVPCYNTHVATLHRADEDGRTIRQISSNVEHDNTPAVMPDGRILHMRWEYVDRSELGFHHLWTMNPDGTSQMVFFGNLHPGTAMLDARPIPGSDKVVAVFSPGHGRKEHAGYLTLVDPDGGPDERHHTCRLHPSGDFRDPYPFSEDCFLVAEKNRLVLVDGEGGTRTLYALAGAGEDCWLHEPRPLRARKRERVVPDRVDWSEAHGSLLLIDVLHGRSMEGVEPGEIKELLVLELLPKPVGFGGVPHALSWWGTLNLQRVLGTVPVEPDGSVYMELPAMRSVFFVALDERRMAVKRMQSFVSVMPGEKTGCAGCHENRTETARDSPAGAVMALRRPPSRIQPIPDVPQVFDFPRDIQPILDRHCVQCHDYGKHRGGVILTGDRGPMYSHSYWTLVVRGQVADGQNGLGNRSPRTIGSSASPLMTKAEGGHHEVKLSAHEQRMIRLWIETGAAYTGTYAALSTGNLYDGDIFLDFTRRARFRKLLQPRCGRCHRDNLELQAKPVRGKYHIRTVRKNDPIIRFSEHVIFNLTRPERSTVLLAPLARNAGGWGLCKAVAKDGEFGDPVVVFRDTHDPGYRELLAEIRRAAGALNRMKRFDMPGFQPGGHYVREMKRYGILKADCDSSDSIDPYATDRAYWKSLWYRPEVR